MKYLLILSIVIQSSYLRGEIKYFFPELDEIAISLIESAENKDVKQCEFYLEELSLSLKECVNNCEIEDEIFIESIDFFLANMYVYQQSYQYQYLEFLTYDLILIFKQRRERNYLTNYPIDKIINLIDTQSRLSGIAKDEMLGKYEWFEFTEFVDRLNKKWDSYLLVSLNTIESYFSEINKDCLLQINSELSICYDELFSAIDTAQRQNFILPCDISEKKLRQLLYCFGKSKKNNQG
jgi:hypothetical protein